jgi:hypothetical protein
MTTKPVLSFLEATLCTCRIAGTSVRESGLAVSTEVLSGETIFFFKTDGPEGRKCLAMLREGVKICDYLIFYTRDNEVREIICFLELKGKKLENAAKQVISTFSHFSSLAPEVMRRRESGQFSCMVYICLHGQAPRNGQRCENQLKEIFGKGNVRIKHGVKHDRSIGTFLRQKDA